MCPPDVAMCSGGIWGYLLFSCEAGGRRCCRLLPEPAAFPSCSDSATVDTDGTVSVGETAVLPYRPEINLRCSARPGVIPCAWGWPAPVDGGSTVTLGELWAAQVGSEVDPSPAWDYPAFKASSESC